LGDAAEMCIIELVDYNENYTQNKGSKRAKAKATRRGSRTRRKTEVTDAIEEKTPIIEDISVEKKTPSVEEVPAVTDAEIVEEAPTIEEVVEETTDVEVPAAVEAEIVEETTDVEKKEEVPAK
jgi:large subunit ribosomal protein L17